jgi:hypothetical protein
MPGLFTQVNNQHWAHSMYTTIFLYYFILTQNYLISDLIILITVRYILSLSAGTFGVKLWTEKVVGSEERDGNSEGST